ncbi:NAD(P)/FAD-dependent oxidoreductase [Spirosoma sp. KCTC 42546]|uniref:NAD(P)/FAD-dependent oxidoreductase n=1 Tax=Spirosoma sp. KCTC 42546 TaxID=2520506 RepID=UPI00115AA3FB|nr:NAD(P)/FAD-dependent oxidoreductase [Spirosoma sp. KCTC 42546]QDK78010.1 NAD(P)/FAD-dependent oxidoreductase [Spirosoma sp. KCTC 42546]
MTSAQPDYEIIIVGGSYAGLSAALVLGRSLRRVLVLDSGQPANRQTPHSHSFLTRDGATPAELATIARQQALAYSTVTIKTATVTRAIKQDTGFIVSTDAGDSYSAGRLLLATGLTDQMLPIPGFAECWGISVLHCPYCHGYEVHGQALGVLANGDAGFEMGRLIHHWSANLTLFTNGPSTLSPEQTAALKRHQITIIETPISVIPHQDGQLSGLLLANQTHYPLAALFARPPMHQASTLGWQLGCLHDDMGFVQVDDFGRTTIPGVFAAGDTHTMMRQVTVAATNGMRAAVTLNKEMLEETF